MIRAVEQKEFQKGVVMLLSESQMWKLILGIQAYGGRGRIANELEASKNYIVSVKEASLTLQDLV